MNYAVKLFESPLEYKNWIEMNRTEFEIIDVSIMMNVVILTYKP